MFHLLDCSLNLFSCAFFKRRHLCFPDVDGVGFTVGVKIVYSGGECENSDVCRADSSSVFRAESSWLDSIRVQGSCKPTLIVLWSFKIGSIMRRDLSQICFFCNIWKCLTKLAGPCLITYSKRVEAIKTVFLQVLPFLNGTIDENPILFFFFG